MWIIFLVTWGVTRQPWTWKRPMTVFKIGLCFKWLLMLTTHILAFLPHQRETVSSQALQGGPQPFCRHHTAHQKHCIVMWGRKYAICYNNIYIQCNDFEYAS